MLRSLHSSLVEPLVLLVDQVHQIVLLSLVEEVLVYKHALGPWLELKLLGLWIGLGGLWIGLE